MASYSDDHYVDFWSSLLEDPILKKDISKMKALGMQQRDIVANSASRRIIDKAEDQLKHMHGIHGNKDFPSAKVGIVKEWKQAWHFWNVHTEPWKVSQELCQPFGGDIPLFTCGEAYSLEQGWVEGALKSAERVLAMMGTQHPQWLQSMNHQELKEYIEH
jgi:hypothetical protein